MTAIDDMCAQLLTPAGEFDMAKFRELNDDPSLVGEILGSMRNQDTHGSASGRESPAFV
jgi:hypothetical protein